MKREKNRVKWIAGIIVVTAVAAVGSVVLFNNTVQAKSGKDLFEIKTWTRKDCSVTPWTVAVKKGFLAEEGIKLVETGETQPPLQLPSILRGNNDVGTAHPNTLAVAIAGGAKVVGVVQGGIEPTDPKIPEELRHMWWFVNPKKHPDVRSFADLKKIPGKIKIGTITKNICADFETNLLADKAGIPRNKIEWVTMPDVQAIQALKQGLIDVSIPHPPFFKGSLDAGARKIADTFETGLGASAGITYYYFRKDYVAKYPDQVAAFARAMTKAQKWANEHGVEAAKLTEQAIGVPVAGNHWYSTITKIDEKLPVPWIKDLEANGVIPKGKVTVDDLITHEIEKVNLRVAAERAKAAKAAKGKKS